MGRSWKTKLIKKHTFYWILKELIKFSLWGLIKQDFLILALFFLLYKSILINVLGFQGWTQAMFSTRGGGGDFLSSSVDASTFFFILNALAEKCCHRCFPNENP